VRHDWEQGVRRDLVYLQACALMHDCQCACDW
jgi:hypothetical protein